MTIARRTGTAAVLGPLWDLLRARNASITAHSRNNAHQWLIVYVMSSRTIFNCVTINVYWGCIKGWVAGVCTSVDMVWLPTHLHNVALLCLSVI